MIKGYSNENYINDFIISYLERLTKSELAQRDVPWDDMRLALNRISDKGLMPAFHRLMQPYYEMYLFADTSLMPHDHNFSRAFMEYAADMDKDFGLWASSKDIISATECWGDYLKMKNDGSIGYYCRLLQLLFFGSYKTDLEKLQSDLKEILQGAEVNCDYKTGELFCMLHATVCIMKTKRWNRQKKEEEFGVLIEHWDFMKLFYSVMIRRIVGCKYTNFSALTNQVKMSSAHHPHAHIYYCALMERLESLNLNVKQYKKVDDSLQRLLNEILNTTQPSEILYDLCDVLFPEDFQKMLRDHKPKSYKDVEKESCRKDELIEQLSKQKKNLEDDLKRIKGALHDMITGSIPIEEVDNELMKYDPATAWNLLCELNNSQVLLAIDAWRNSIPVLINKYRSRLFDNINEQEKAFSAMRIASERPTNIYNYTNGATHNDKRLQLSTNTSIENKFNHRRIENE